MSKLTKFNDQPACLAGEMVELLNTEPGSQILAYDHEDPTTIFAEHMPGFFPEDEREMEWDEFDNPPYRYSPPPCNSVDPGCGL